MTANIREAQDRLVEAITILHGPQYKGRCNDLRYRIDCAMAELNAVRPWWKKILDKFTRWW